MREDRPLTGLTQLAVSTLRFDRSGITIAPKRAKLPERFTLLDLLRGMPARHRRTFMLALRRGLGRGTPFDIGFEYEGCFFAGRLAGTSTGGGEGLVWVADVPSLDAVLSRVGTCCGVCRTDGCVLAAGEEHLVGRPLSSLDADAAPLIMDLMHEQGDSRRRQARIVQRLADRERYLELTVVPVPGTDLLVFSILDDTARQMASDRADRSVRELNHRVRNAMSVVTALISLSAPHAESVEEFAQATLARISALDIAYSLTGTNPLEPHRYRTQVDLAELASKILGADPAVDLCVTRLAITPGQATALGLILHELVTNARRHGVLTARTGRLSVEWRADETGYVIVWREKGGGPVDLSSERFGLSIVRTFAQNYLNGDACWEPTADGLVVTITAQRD